MRQGDTARRVRRVHKGVGNAVSWKCSATINRQTRCRLPETAWHKCSAECFEESSLKAGGEMLRNALCVQAALGSDRDDVVVHGVILSVTQWVEKIWSAHYGAVCVNDAIFWWLNWLKRGKNATVSGFWLFLHCQYKICLIWRTGRCVFHFKVQTAFVWLACRCKKQPARWKR